MPHQSQPLPPSQPSRRTVTRVARTSTTLVATLALVVLGAACSNDDSESSESSASTGAPTTTTVAEVLRILVTNDDGFAAPGIDALVEGLRTLPDVEVTVVAPAENQSGTSDSTSAGPLTAQEVTTQSGYPAISVPGFPADSVEHALDEVFAEPPHLVVSGNNQGQNVGPLIDVSGTVGAARTAARRGIPALAVSQGLGDPVDYDAGVALALDWVREHRAELLTGGSGAVTVANLNVPSCPAGEVRGVVEVPPAGDLEGRDAFTTDCTSTLANPRDDAEALVNGFASLSELSAS
jgi:5'-nucleotidase